MVMVKTELDMMVGSLEFAYQPIVNIHTGTCIGYEALLRGVDSFGYESPAAFFDDVTEQGVLERIEFSLLVKAFGNFLDFGSHLKAQLFINLDGRSLAHIPTLLREIQKMTEGHDYAHDMIVFELSERNILNYDLQLSETLDAIRNTNCKIALDDFGVGYSGMQLLYCSDPHYVKIDRFFIQGIEYSPKKKFFVQNLISMVHLMGLYVIAEGIETPDEYYCCRQLGADLAQGNLIDHPKIDFSQFTKKSYSIQDLIRDDRKRNHSDERRLVTEMRVIPPVSLYKANGKLNEISNVLEEFKGSPDELFLPVINERKEPIGIIREKDLKEFVFSPFGHSLLRNQTSSIRYFIRRCPFAELGIPTEKILDLFSREDGNEGVILTENGRYAGVLDARNLLLLMQEKTVSLALDQNPLTSLPGNRAVSNYITGIVEDVSTSCIMVHFDFDHFKPFNDKYGFRTGDRAILIFSEILKDIALRHQAFIGHIGGDDFFAGVTASSGMENEIIGSIKQAIFHFSDTARMLYSEEDRERGYIVMPDRQGDSKDFSLLTVSAAIIALEKGEGRYSAQYIDVMFAEGKKHAKLSPDHVSYMKLCGGAHCLNPGFLSKLS